LKHAEIFQNLFKGSPEAHYSREADGAYLTVNRAIELADTERHLSGITPSILSIPILRDGNSHFGAIDVDRHDDADPPVDHVALAKRVTELALPLVVCKSKHPKSAHLWLFLKEKNGLSAVTVCLLLRKYVQMLAIAGEVEIFPKQEQLLKADQIGNGINLSYFGSERIAYGRDGEELDLDGFIAMATERRAFGQILASRDLLKESSVSASDGPAERKKYPPMTANRAAETYGEKLEALHTASTGNRNIVLNDLSFFAGQAFTANALHEAEGKIKHEIEQAGLASGLCKSEVHGTARSGWNAGLKEPLSIVEVTTASAIKRPDMPDTVLDGQLGKWCCERLPEFPIAYSWPAILGAASVLVKPHAKNRCNLFVCLVGPIHSSKSQAQERANYLFNLKELGLLEDLKSGSAEGLLEKIGDRQGAPLLWCPDELSHLLEKSQIQGASFPFILNSLFYCDSNKLTVAKRKQINFDARMTLTGGLVEETFGDSFGSATTAGLYDRFLFGICPSDFQYAYRPMSGPPLFEIKNVLGKDLFTEPGTGKETDLKIVAPEIHSEVWDARDELRKSEGIEPRILEICIRVALICAAWDRKTVLRAVDLGPAWELARYQQRVRGLLQPNPGKNFEGIVAIKILNFLKEHSDGEKWIPWRTVCRSTHIFDYGPSTTDRAVNSMVFAGDLESAEVQGRKGGPRKRLVRLAVEE
jgi:hypothetical protein